MSAYGPKDLFDLHEAWKEREARSDYRVAVLGSIILGAMGSKENGAPWAPADLFGYFTALKDQRPAPEFPEQEHLEAKLIAALGAERL